MTCSVNAETIKKELKKYSNTEKANILQRFFKTGPGEYAEGDIFIGLKVPEIRSVVNKNVDISLTEVKKLLKSKIHEERLAALLFLVAKFDKQLNEKETIYNIYIKNTKYINNWDLVDLSAYRIVGAYLLKRDKSILYELVESTSLWERRIAILSTFHYIKNNDFKDALKISQKLLKDEHDLIHKAVGWMLKEIGKRDLPVEEKFLKMYHKIMPRTMLRSAIERFPENKRLVYLKGKV
ncbi:MAG: DNA alkylation repair protein [Candidatus Omnitrophica bacterium]|nr:DNA alkylation repair protein [Candidatus Omnitrophota bacterium]